MVAMLPDDHKFSPLLQHTEKTLSCNVAVVGSACFQFKELRNESVFKLLPWGFKFNWPFIFTDEYAEVVLFWIIVSAPDEQSHALDINTSSQVSRQLV